MKIFRLTEPASEEHVRIALHDLGIKDEAVARYLHRPQEDYTLASQAYPIFVVADGVTLMTCLFDGKAYPDPSPAGEAARIVCETFVRAAEDRYASFSGSDIPEIFQLVNEAVAVYNAKRGRESGSVNYWNLDYYSATAAFAVVKDGVLYWGSICDASVILVDPLGAQRFHSPKRQELVESRPAPFIGDDGDPGACAQYRWRELRNKVNNNGKRVGYGVVTGEPNALLYLASGQEFVQSGEILLLCTDGFEPYTEQADFISLFTQWPADLDQQVRGFTMRQAQEQPNVFGSERSLIVVSL